MPAFSSISASNVAVVLFVIALVSFLFIFCQFNGRQLPDLLIRTVWYKVRLCQTTNQSTHCGEVYIFNVDSRVCDTHFSGA